MWGGGRKKRKAGLPHGTLDKGSQERLHIPRTIRTQPVVAQTTNVQAKVDPGLVVQTQRGKAVHLEIAKVVAGIVDSFQRVESTTTDAEGRFGFQYTFREPGDYVTRTVFDSEPGFEGSTSPMAIIRVSKDGTIRRILGKMVPNRVEFNAGVKGTTPQVSIKLEWMKNERSEGPSDGKRVC
jgi:hypothetical protein